MWQLPWHFKIQDYEISIVGIGIILFILVFIFVYWRLGENKKGGFVSFDNSFLSLMAALMAARLLAVINNLDYYFKEGGSVFNLLDKNYLYSGIFLGLLVAGLLLFQSSKRESFFYNDFEKVVISYAYAIIPLLIAALLAGKMLGVTVQGAFGITYENEISRMPLNIFRIAYTLLFLAIWTVIGRQSKEKGLWGLIYILLYAVIEFMLRYFSSDYSPSIANLIDISQLAVILVMVIGIIFFVDYYNLRSLNIKSRVDSIDGLSRRQFNNQRDLSSRYNGTQRERFSLSYSNIQDSVNDNESNIQEKLKIWWNTIRRRSRK